MEREMEAPGFWDDPERSNQKMKELKNLKDTVGECDKLSTQFDDILTLIDMGYEENDASLIPEIREELDEFIREFDELRIGTLLSGEYDKNNAILKLNAGAGGTESCDWCGMLYRMYTRWAERHGYAWKTLDYEECDEAGIKSAVISIEGENAYGLLKSEHGVHRLVRVSPFDANARRQTSFAAVEVMPELPDDVEVEIRPEDIDLVKPEDGTLQGVVTHLIFKGVHYEMEVTTPDGYEWLVHSTDMFPVGQKVGIHVDPFDIQIMNKPESEDEEAAEIDV